MSRAPHIFGWLDAVKIDGQLPASCFKVAYQLAQKTNTAEFEKSGTLVTWQSIPTLADAIKMSERTVSDMASRLEAAGHLAIETGRGRGHSNRYKLIQQNRQPAAVFNDAKTGSRLQQLDQQNLQSDVLKPAVQRRKTGSRLQPNYSISNSITSPTTAETDTENRGPRQRADALGPLGEKLEARIGPARFHDWFVRGCAELVSQTADTVTMAVKSALYAEQIRNRFDSDIAACSGAPRLEFVVREAGAPERAP